MLLVTYYSDGLQMKWNKNEMKNVFSFEAKFKEIKKTIEEESIDSAVWAVPETVIKNS